MEKFNLKESNPTQYVKDALSDAKAAQENKNLILGLLDKTYSMNKRSDVVNLIMSNSNTPKELVYNIIQFGKLRNIPQRLVKTAMMVLDIPPIADVNKDGVFGWIDIDKFEEFSNSISDMCGEADVNKEGLDVIEMAEAVESRSDSWEAFAFALYVGVELLNEKQ